jgi:hypothetical protein
MGRAFSPFIFTVTLAWGVAPGWYELRLRRLKSFYFVHILTNHPTCLALFLYGQSEYLRFERHFQCLALFLGSVILMPSSANGATHTSLGQRPRSGQIVFILRAESPYHSSIPHISFVILNAIFLQQCAVFLLKCFELMVFLLIFDICYQSF